VGSSRIATVAVAVAIGTLTFVLSETVLPGEVPAVTVALIAGLAVGALRTHDLDAASGVVKYALPVAIVLIGLRISLSRVRELGLETLGLTIVALAVGLGVALLAARALGVPSRLGTLLALGTAICGNTAIVSAAPILRARRDEIAYAVATITLFGTTAVLLFPVLGHAFGLDDTQFGIWAGLGVNDTSQVVATGYAFSEPAGETATVVKLVRNVFLGPLLLGVALLSPDARGSEVRPRLGVPWFIWGFALAAIAASVGIVPNQVEEAASSAATLLVLVVMAAVGLSTRLGALRTVGLRPLAVGLVAMSALSLVVLGAVVAGVGKS